MRTKMLSAACVWCLSGVLAGVARAEVSGVYTACATAARRDVDARNRCASDELNRQDARMTAAYSLVMKRLLPGGPGQKRLSVEQKKFLKSRDKECGNDNTCQLNLTTARVDELESEAKKTAAE